MQRSSVDGYGAPPALASLLLKAYLLPLRFALLHFTDAVFSLQIEICGKHQQKDYDSLKAQVMVSIA